LFIAVVAQDNRNGKVYDLCNDVDSELCIFSELVKFYPGNSTKLTIR